MSRCITALALLILGGCASSHANRSTSTFILRGEAGVTGRPLSDPGAVGTAAVGFSTGKTCCAMSAFVGALGHSDQEARDQDVDGILGAGVEAMTMLPFLWERLGLELRLGAAGTRPEVPRLGRRGYMGSGSVVVRLSDPVPPPVSSWAPLVELGLGLNWWSLNDERSSAGPAPTHDSKAQTRLAAMLSLRVGASYGVDLQ